MPKATIAISKTAITAYSPLRFMRTPDAILSGVTFETRTGSLDGGDGAQGHDERRDTDGNHAGIIDDNRLDPGRYGRAFAGQAGGDLVAVLAATLDQSFGTQG